MSRAGIQLNIDKILKHFHSASGVAWQDATTPALPNAPWSPTPSHAAESDPWQS